MYGEAKQFLKEEWALAQREDTRHDESAAVFFLKGRRLKHSKLQ